jgi:hypothetical protein
MDLLPTDSIGTPARWLICFQRHSDLWWVERFCPGRFKHVRAFGYAREPDCWIFYDVALRTTVHLARGGAARALMLDWTRDAVVLAMDPLPGYRVRLPPFCCTTAIANLMGVRTAIFPTALYRHCLRAGAIEVESAA